MTCGIESEQIDDRKLPAETWPADSGYDRRRRRSAAHEDEDEKANEREKEKGKAPPGVHGPYAHPLAKVPSNPGPDSLSGPSLQQRVVDKHGPGLFAQTQNSVISPNSAPDNRESYCDRPLPLVPALRLRKTPTVAPLSPVSRPPPSPTMVVRPSTSCGPGQAELNLSRPQLALPGAQPDRWRLSKDDMYLTTSTMRLAPYNRRLQPHIIGGKRRAPPTLQLSSDDGATTSLRDHAITLPSPRMATPESPSSCDIPIGMALGSPSHAPSWQAPPPTYRSPTPTFEVVSPPVRSQTAGTLTNLEQPPATALRSAKPQKRKLFGNLFGGRKQQEPRAEVKSVLSGGLLTRAPLATRASSARPSRTESTPERTVPSRQQTVVPSPTPSESRIFLDVDIPDIRLERYSVMFKGVFEPTGSSSSSLLARRQATLERLKTANASGSLLEDEEDDRGRPKYRRATSPQFAPKSPAFVLFPPTPGSNSESSVPRRPSSHTRSNTSPAVIPSPSRARFGEGSSGSIPRMQTVPALRKAKKSVTVVSPRTMDERDRSAKVERLRELRNAQIDSAPAMVVPPEAGFRFREVDLLEESPNSLSSAEQDVHENQSVKCTIPEPQLLMARSSSSGSGPPKQGPAQAHNPASSGSKRSASVSTTSSSVVTNATSASATGTAATSGSSIGSNPAHNGPRSPSVQIEEGDLALKEAVENSIARQISLSRQQRQLLVRPGQASSMAGAASQSQARARVRRGVDATHAIGMARGEPARVAEVRGTTPTFVVPGQSLEDQMMAHRRSERIVVEGD